MSEPSTMLISRLFCAFSTLQETKGLLHNVRYFAIKSGGLRIPFYSVAFLRSIKAPSGGQVGLPKKTGGFS